MFALTILCMYDKLTGWPPAPFHLSTEFDTSAQAELRALRWLMYRPNDIIMLLEAP
jgi:hypothetical protein